MPSMHPSLPSCNNKMVSVCVGGCLCNKAKRWGDDDDDDDGACVSREQY